MKTRFSLFTLLTLLWLLLNTASTASAQTLYENGPINGEELAWTINLNFGVADSFMISNPSSTVTGLSFGAWLIPGDTLERAEVSITQFPFGGTTYFDGTVNFTASGCFLNNLSFEVCTETRSFNGPTLEASTYWLDLQNAVSADGNPVYWDMNDGVGCHSLGCPSEASVGEGTIPSEAFSVLGTSGGGGTTPEPGSLLLLASGVVSSVAILRRKFL